MTSTKENDGHSMGPANPFDDVFSTKGHVQVKYQIHSGWLPFDGMSVGEARGYVQVGRMEHPLWPMNRLSPWKKGETE